MPNRLREYLGRFETYTGLVYKWNPDPKYPRMLCLRNIRVKGQKGIVRDHAWIYAPNKALAMNLKPGERIEFTGKVKTYTKKRIGFYYAWGQVQHGIEECGGFKRIETPPPAPTGRLPGNRPES